MEYPIPSAILASLTAIPHATWKVGRTRGNEQRQVRWIEVTRLDLATMPISIGLSENGFWVRGDGATVEEAGGSEAITLLPCIEIPWRELNARLSDGLVRLGFSKELSDTFPIDTLIVTALLSRSEYWTKLALERVQERPATMSLKKALAEAERVAPTQQLRHQATHSVGGSKKETTPKSP